MVERKLNRTQVVVFAALSQQRLELQRAFQELADAEREQVEMLRCHLGLPDGIYQVKQEQNGDVVLFLAPAPADDEGYDSAE